MRVFFRRIEVVGLEHVPATGRVIFCGNHPNSLLDPVLITCFCGRTVHFAAKDTLFRSRLPRFFLRIMGAVPVKRRSDHPEGPLDNEAAFEELFNVLEAGGTMGIFPEGISHNRSQLAGLKTGAARIALGALRRRPELPVRLVPCGLHYVTRTRFRSSVLVQFGPPVTIDEGYVASLGEDERETVRRVTVRLETSLRGLTVNAEDWETLRVLDGVRRLYQPARITLEERVELARRFNTHYPALKGEPAIRSLFSRVAEYLDRLSAAGLTDRDLRRRLGPVGILVRVLRHLLLVLFWLPLAAAGAVIHVPLGFLLDMTGWLARRKDVVATTKFTGGFVVLLAVYTGLPLAMGLTAGWRRGVWALVLLPLSGYALVRVVERTEAVRRLFHTTVRVLVLREEIAELRREREILQAEIVRAVNAFKPEDLELMFPREVPGGGSGSSRSSEVPRKADP